MSSGDFSTSWLILLVSSASTIPAEACHSALIAKGKTHAMFDMESFAFEPHLLGGVERATQSPVRKLSISWEGSVWVAACLLASVSSAQILAISSEWSPRQRIDNSSLTLASNFDVLEMPGQDILSPQKPGEFRIYQSPRAPRRCYWRFYEGWYSLERFFWLQ